MSPKTFGKLMCSTGSNSKSRGFAKWADSDAYECSSHHGCGEDQEDGQRGVDLPFGTGFVGVDVDVRHD